MKNMTQASEYYTPPPKGLYRCTVVQAVEGVSKAGSTMIEITTEIAEGPFKGEQMKDFLLTDGTAKGAGIGRTKLRGLGINVDTDAETPDAVICSQLNGRSIFVTLEHENMTTKESNYTEPRTVIDSKTNQVITMMRARAGAYSLHQVGQLAGAQTQTQAAPQAMQMAPQMAPQAQGGFAQPAPVAQQQALPQAWQQQQAPQYQGQSAGQAPQQFAPPQVQQFAPQPAFNGMPQGNVPAPYQAQPAFNPGFPPGAPQQAQGQAPGFVQPPFANNGQQTFGQKPGGN